MDKSDMHYFDPSVGYRGISQFVKDFYEAYFYLIQYQTAKVMFDSFTLKKNDLYIEFLNKSRDRRNVFNENGRFITNNFKQYVGTIKWYTLGGLDFPKSKDKKDKENRIRISPAMILLHELGHAVEVNLYGVAFLKKCKASSSPEEGYPDLSEYYATTKYEYPVTAELNMKGIPEGKRPYYNYINLGHSRKMLSPTSLIPAEM